MLNSIEDKFISDLGSIIIAKKESNKYIIVDGQQRIITYYLIYSMLYPKKQCCKFVDYTGETIDFNQQKYRNAKKYFENIRKDNLILKDEVFCLDVPEKKQNEIFYSINGTGVSLQVGELIRNYLYKEIAYNKGTKEVRNNIVKICNNVDFIRAYIESKCGYTISENEMYEKFISIFQAIQEDNGKVKNARLGDLLKNFKTFNRLFNSSRNDYCEELVRNLLIYKMLGVTTANPFLLKIAVGVEDGLIEEKVMNEAIKRIISCYMLLYGLNLKNDKKSVGNKFASLCKEKKLKECYKEITAENICPSYKTKSIGDYNNGYKELINSLLNKSWYSDERIGVTTAMLIKIEEYFSNIAVASKSIVSSQIGLLKSINKEQVTVEHICPLSLDDAHHELKNYYPPTVNQRNQMPNLCLLPKSMNSKLRNQILSEKLYSKKINYSQVGREYLIVNSLYEQFTRLEEDYGFTEKDWGIRLHTLQDIIQKSAFKHEMNQVLNK